MNKRKVEIKWWKRFTQELFDPISLGHIDIIKRSLKFCEQLIIAVGNNSAKKTMFSSDKRVEMIHKSIDEISLGVPIAVVRFDELLANLADRIGANILIRGIRSVSDFEYEINLANLNKILAPNVETVFLPTSPELCFISSSAVKEIAKYGGDTSKFVSPYVAEKIKNKIARSA